MLEGHWVVWVAVGLGSATGGLLRHLVTETVTRGLGPAFPWGTLVVNIVGSTAIGVFAALASGPIPWSMTFRHAVITGVLGGFTTFSSFSLQTVGLIEQGQALTAVLYVVGSVVFCVATCWLGFAAVSAMTR